MISPTNNFFKGLLIILKLQILLNSSNSSKYRTFLLFFVLNVNGTLTSKTMSMTNFESLTIFFNHRLSLFLCTLFFTVFFGSIKPIFEIFSSAVVVFITLFSLFFIWYFKVKCVDFFFHHNVLIQWIPFCWIKKLFLSYIYTDNFLRPFALLARITALPPFVLILTKNPCVLFLFVTEGWYVLFMIIFQFEIYKFTPFVFFFKSIILMI